MKNKLLLFLILISFIGYSQNPLRAPYGIQITGGQPTVTSVNFLTTTDNTLSGLQGKIAPINLPIPYVPTNYAVSNQSIGQHLTGIDTRLGQISSTTAGITQRVYFTADNTTVTAGTFYTSSITGKGTATAPSPAFALSLADNTKGYFNKDLISIAQPSPTIGYAGTYSGNLTVSATPTPNATQQRFTIEIYRTNNGGTPIASGVSGAPIGDLGVTVLAILDSGVINLNAGLITNVPINGILTQNVTINTGERLRYHVSAAKIGAGGGNVIFGVYYGTSYNSYYDVPVAITTDAVVNKVPGLGITSTDALNNLKAVQDTKLNKTYVTNYDVADSNTTISGTTFDAFGILCQSLTNKIFMIYREGAGHISTDGKIVMRTSVDGGKTFSARTIIHSDVAGIDCRNIAGGVTPSGRIVVFFLKYNSTVPTFYSQGVIYSDDDGATWSNYTIQTVPGGSSGYSPYGNMITVADGKLALPYYIEKADGTEATYLKFSIDNGLTWGNDVLVASDLTNGYSEASYAYLDGGIVLCVVRRKDTLLLSQLISTDNGQTWTNQGLIPSVYGSNVAPWLNTYIESNGEKYVALFSTLRGVTAGVNGIVGKKSDIISSGVSAWLAETRMILNTSVNSDSGYPAVINPRGGKKMLGMSYSSNSTANQLSAIANYKFWNYTPNAVVPALTGTTNYLPKKTGNASLTDSRVMDDGAVLSIGSKVNSSGSSYLNHYANYSNIFQFKNLNIQELSTSGSEESTLLFNNYYDATNNSRYLFNGGATLMYFGRSFFQIAKASTGTAGSVLTGITVPFKINYSTGNTLINGATDNSVDALQVSGTVSGSAATLSNQFVTKSQLDAVAPPGIKRYMARLTQTGTSAPTVVILENSLSGTPSWSFNSTGIFLGTLTDQFTIGKTVIFIYNPQGSSQGDIISSTTVSDDSVQINSKNSAGVLTNALLTGTIIQVIVYP